MTGRRKFRKPIKLGRLRPGPVLSAKGICGCPGISVASRIMSEYSSQLSQRTIKVNLFNTFDIMSALPYNIPEFAISQDYERIFITAFSTTLRMFEKNAIYGIYNRFFYLTKFVSPPVVSLKLINVANFVLLMKYPFDFLHYLSAPSG